MLQLQYLGDIASTQSESVVVPGVGQHAKGGLPASRRVTCFVTLSVPPPSCTVSVCPGLRFCHFRAVTIRDKSARGFGIGQDSEMKESYRNGSIPCMPLKIITIPYMPLAPYVRHKKNPPHTIQWHTRDELYFSMAFRELTHSSTLGLLN